MYSRKILSFQIFHIESHFTCEYRILFCSVCFSFISFHWLAYCTQCWIGIRADHVVALFLVLGIKHIDSLLNILLTVGYHRYYCQVVEFPFIPNLPRVYHKLMFLFFFLFLMLPLHLLIGSVFFVRSVNMMNHIEPPMNYWNEFHFLMYYPLYLVLDSIC